MDRAPSAVNVPSDTEIIQGGSKNKVGYQRFEMLSKNHIEYKKQKNFKEKNIRIYILIAGCLSLNYIKI